MTVFQEALRDGAITALILLSPVIVYILAFIAQYLIKTYLMNGKEEAR